MNNNVSVLFVGGVFIAVLLVSQLLLLPTFGTRREDSIRLRKRLADVLLASGDDGLSIIKVNYLNKLPPFERMIEVFLGNLGLKILLEQAGVKLMAYRFILIVLALSVVIAGFVFVYCNQWLLALFAFLIAALFPFLRLQHTKIKRLIKFEEQLPEALHLMSKALSIGYSFGECMKMVASEMHNPISQEFEMTYQEINYGRDISVAFSLMIQRVPSISLMAMSTAIIIQNETGGNLSEVLLKISSVLNARFKLQRRIKTLTAEGIMSAWILVLLPIGLFLLINFTNPDYYVPFYESPDKYLYIGIFAGFELIALVWIRWIITIDA